MRRYPYQKPGYFGAQRLHVNSGQIGGTNFLGGASPLTANTTTIFRLGAPPLSCLFDSFAVSVVTVPADADGTILGYIYKYDASADAAVQISASMNLEALVTREVTRATFLSTATEAQLRLDTGDALEFHVVNNSAAIDTQPAGLVVVAEVLALE